MAKSSLHSGRPLTSKLSFLVLIILHHIEIILIFKSQNGPTDSNIGTISTLISSGTDVGIITSVTLEWINDIGLPSIGSCTQQYCPNHIYVQNVVVSELDNFPEAYYSISSCASLIAQSFKLRHLIRNRLTNTFTNCPYPKANYVDMTSGSSAKFYVATCPND